MKSRYEGIRRSRNSYSELYVTVKKVSKDSGKISGDDGGIRVSNLVFSMSCCIVQYVIRSVLELMLFVCSTLDPSAINHQQSAAATASAAPVTPSRPYVYIATTLHNGELGKRTRRHAGPAL